MHTGTFYSLGKEDFEKSIHVEVSSIDIEEDDIELVENSPKDSFSQVIRDLILFQSRIGNKFITCNERYQYGCGGIGCNYTLLWILLILIREYGLSDLLEEIFSKAFRMEEILATYCTQTAKTEERW